MQKDNRAMMAARERQQTPRRGSNTAPETNTTARTNRTASGNTATNMAARTPAPRGTRASGNGATSAANSPPKSARKRKRSPGRHRRGHGLRARLARCQRSLHHCLLRCRRFRKSLGAAAAPLPPLADLQRALAALRVPQTTATTAVPAAVSITPAPALPAALHAELARLWRRNGHLTRAIERRRRQRSSERPRVQVPREVVHAAGRALRGDSDDVAAGPERRAHLREAVEILRGGTPRVPRERPSSTGSVGRVLDDSAGAQPPRSAPVLGAFEAKNGRSGVGSSVSGPSQALGPRWNAGSPYYVAPARQNPVAVAFPSAAGTTGSTTAHARGNANPQQPLQPPLPLRTFANPPPPRYNVALAADGMVLSPVALRSATTAATMLQTLMEERYPGRYYPQTPGSGGVERGDGLRGFGPTMVTRAQLLNELEEHRAAAETAARGAPRHDMLDTHPRAVCAREALTRVLRPEGVPVGGGLDEDCARDAWVVAPPALPAGQAGGVYFPREVVRDGRTRWDRAPFGDARADDLDVIFARFTGDEVDSTEDTENQSAGLDERSVEDGDLRAQLPWLGSATRTEAARLLRVYGADGAGMTSSSPVVMELERIRRQVALQARQVVEATDEREEEAPDTEEEGDDEEENGTGARTHNVIVMTLFTGGRRGRKRRGGRRRSKDRGDSEGGANKDASSGNRDGSDSTEGSPNDADRKRQRRRGGRKRSRDRDKNREHEMAEDPEETGEANVAGEEEGPAEEDPLKFPPTPPWTVPPWILPPSGLLRKFSKIRGQLSFGSDKVAAEEADTYASNTSAEGFGDGSVDQNDDGTVSSRLCGSQDTDEGAWFSGSEGGRSRRATISHGDGANINTNDRLTALASFLEDSSRDASMREANARQNGRSRSHSNTSTDSDISSTTSSGSFGWNGGRNTGRGVVEDAALYQFFDPAEIVDDEEETGSSGSSDSGLHPLMQPAPPESEPLRPVQQQAPVFAMGGSSSSTDESLTWKQKSNQYRQQIRSQQMQGLREEKKYSDSEEQQLASEQDRLVRHSRGLDGDGGTEKGGSTSRTAGQLQPRRRSDSVSSLDSTINGAGGRDVHVRRYTETEIQGTDEQEPQQQSLAPATNGPEIPERVDLEARLPSHWETFCAVDPFVPAAASAETGLLGVPEHSAETVRRLLLRAAAQQEEVLGGRAGRRYLRQLRVPAALAVGVGQGAAQSAAQLQARVAEFCAVVRADTVQRRLLGAYETVERMVGPGLTGKSRLTLLTVLDYPTRLGLPLRRAVVRAPHPLSQVWNVDEVDDEEEEEEYGDCEEGESETDDDDDDDSDYDEIVDFGGMDNIQTPSTTSPPSSPVRRKRSIFEKMQKFVWGGSKEQRGEEDTSDEEKENGGCREDYAHFCRDEEDPDGGGGGSRESSSTLRPSTTLPAPSSTNNTNYGKKTDTQTDSESTPVTAAHPSIPNESLAVPSFDYNHGNQGLESTDYPRLLVYQMLYHKYQRQRLEHRGLVTRYQEYLARARATVPPMSYWYGCAGLRQLWAAGHVLETALPDVPPFRATIGDIAARRAARGEARQRVATLRVEALVGERAQTAAAIVAV